MKLMFNLSTVGVYTAIVSAITIPVVHAHAGLIQNVFGSHLHHNANPSPEFKSVSPSIFGRGLRRELQLDSFGECVNKRTAQLLQDPVFNETRDANENACSAAFQGWLTEDGITVQQNRDWRNCDQSEFIAYCQANYQLINLPDYNVKCAKRGDDPNRPWSYDEYCYDQKWCLARDPSCPSDSVALTEQDIASMWNSDLMDGVNCTVEFLEEGHQPPPKPAPKVPDNLSEECLNENAMMFEDAAWRNANDKALEAIENCTSFPEPRYVVGDDTITVVDMGACAEQSDHHAYYDAISYLQPINFKNRKIICPGRNILYFYNVYDTVGKSCPSDQGDWTANDLNFIFQGFEACDIEIFEEGDVPPRPPTDEEGDMQPPPPTEDSPTEATPVPPKTEDTPTEAPVEAQSAAASEPLLTKTIALLSAVAAMTLAALY
jgi:hypothetical protein